MHHIVDRILTYALTPVKWAYQSGVWFRNMLYDGNVLKQKSFDIPVISVGNLTIGGTGKTPHVEHIVGLFKDRYNIAVISRGYKRKTKGFILASSTSTPDTIGDEPYQIYRKHGDRIKLAVTKDRIKGIEKILKLFPETNLIVLDDAFQYRKLKPLVSILLLDSNRPIDKDDLLPLGRLREPQHASERADMLIITKCPDRMLPFEYREKSKTVNSLSFQKMFFSSVKYKDLEPVFPDYSPYTASLERLTDKDSVLLVTGIAHPRSFVKYFKNYPFKVRIMRFPDHHNFTKKDMKAISSYYSRMEGKKKLIITTEKDAVRLLHNPYYPHRLKPFSFYLPIDVRMHSAFEGHILEDELEKAINSGSGA